MSCSDGSIFSRGDWEEAVRVLRQQESPDGPIVAVVAGVLVRFGHRDARYPRQIRFDDPRWGVLWVAVVMGDQGNVFHCFNQRKLPSAQMNFFGIRSVFQKELCDFEVSFP